MSQLFFVLLVALIANISCADVGPEVEITEIGTNSILFDVRGADTVDGKPVKSIYVNYTEITNGTKLESAKVHKIVHGGEFQRYVNLTGLKPATKYWFELYLVNIDDKRGPSSKPLEALLRPQTPDFSLTHIATNVVRLNWGFSTEATIDYFILEIQTVSTICKF